MTSFDVSLFTVVAAESADRPILERLWAMFRHDMSAYSNALPDKVGRFRQERLDAGFDTPGWRVYRFSLGDAAVGMAIVRGLDTQQHIISSFFLVHGARRAGLGLHAAQHVIHHNPGVWSVAFHTDNHAAGAFWRRVATNVAGKDWSETRRNVPGRTDLPPDCWVSFTTKEVAR
ncbi:MAG: family N-acetyltransferase [Glaciihabitans sp.]|nr:family N-acetyltransferase [Glaciihabitans sp.]